MFAAFCISSALKWKNIQSYLSIKLSCENNIGLLSSSLLNMARRNLANIGSSQWIDYCQHFIYIIFILVRSTETIRCHIL